MVRFAAIAGILCAACGDDGAAAGDAAVDASADAAPADAMRDLALRCDPAETWHALDHGPGTALGDSEPASPDEVGDGAWHLFVGMNLSATATPDVYIFDATAADPTGTFALPAQPIVMTKDTYDTLGQETPAYLRWDAHTEYLYYTAIASYAPLSASVAAYRRVDGGAWTKLGPVMPYAPNEIVQSEPTVVRDPASGQLAIIYLSLASDGTVGLAERTSADPAQLSAAGATAITSSDGSAPFAARAAMSFDPYAHVFRTAFDVGYPTPVSELQTFGPTTMLTAAELAAGATLHAGAHATHPELHVDATTCTPASCPQGAVLQPSKAIYPNATDVIFFYSGWSTLPGLQVNGQRCRRSHP